MIQIPNENEWVFILNYPPYPEITNEENIRKYEATVKRVKQNLNLLASFKTEGERLEFILHNLELLYQYTVRCENLSEQLKSNSPE